MKHIVLQPSFYNKFECIGSDCKYNCCREWSIGITKKELKDMKKNIKTEEFRKIFEDAFEKYQFDIFNYKIKLDENNRCKFLDEYGLCKIYKEMGSENMSLTCKIFPRQPTYFIGKYECFLDIACEEVVRLLLKEKEGIKLDIIEREITDAEKRGAARIDSVKANKNSLYHYYTEFKILLLGVLQNREYNFGERMIVLGMAIKKIEDMRKTKLESKETIPSYIQQFVADFNDSKNKDIYSKLFEKVDKSGKKRLFNSIVYHYNGTKAKEDLKIQEKINNRVGIKINLKIGEEKIQTLNIEYDIEKYQQAIKDFEEFIKGKEYWIENVIIEGFLSHRFPFFINGGLWRNYCAMATIYSLFLFMWTCCLEKDSTEEDFIYYTSEFSKSLFNNPTHTTKLEERLNQTESETLGHMAALVL
ncbi:flagellin lysine-N-methylase [Clostridium sp. MD294]|uniref:flagellin lysine-N-methylase n=1 Tax=Clostridium sp. MD294 TaxID=97138 RepID=UPI0002C9F7E5|nr:flagellin lysine-N-methylase [Clostridium sp. MD294]NDO45912.1 YkgJ family cysteine cluster protein [Clostridium sp. MD294]USF30429.1 hypothetical protein C820_001870 [Clostridium sp. MD294]